MIPDEWKSDIYFRRIAILSAAMAVLLGVLFFRQPAHDGDSYDYAGLARNIFRDHELREDLLRSYAVPGQTLPHPSAERANLYSFFLVVFYALFRDTHWAFSFPSLIGIFLLPLVCYRTGRRFLGPRWAFFAALLTAFAPAFLRLYTLMDPGQPEVWQAIFYLLFAAALIDERHAAAGALMACAFLFRYNSIALIPAAALWLLLHKRHKPFSAPVLKLFGVAALIVAPFLIRNQFVFGIPVYTEQMRGVSRIYDGTLLKRFERGDMIGMIFNYDAHRSPPPPGSDQFSIRARSALRAVRINTRDEFLGHMTDIFYSPGLFQAIGLFLLPFLLLGCLQCRGPSPLKLLLLISALQIALQALMAPYWDRYLICVLPFIFMLAAVGLASFEGWLRGAYPRVDSARLTIGLVAFVLLTESSGYLLMNAMRLMASPTDTIYNEMKSTCDFIKRDSRKRDVVMTYPFFSTQFLCDRPTVPVPYGDFHSAAKAAAEYKVKYFLFATLWPGDLFPTPPFASPVFRGKRVSLFTVDPAKLRDFQSGEAHSSVSTLNALQYFFTGRASFEVAPPVYKLLIRAAHNYFVGLLLHLLIGVAFIHAVTRPRLVWNASIIMLTALLFIYIQIVYHSKLFQPMNDAAPRFSRVEAGLYLRGLPSRPRRILVPGAPDFNQYSAEDLRDIFPDTRIAASAFPSPRPHELVFIPVEPKSAWLITPRDIAHAIRLRREYESRIVEIESLYLKKGLKVQTIYGGVFIATQ